MGGAAVIGETRSAVSGRFADVSNGEMATLAKPDRLVWAVTLEAVATICPPPPGGPACWSPRPGTITAYLDYYTGEILGSSTYSPSR